MLADRVATNHFTLPRWDGPFDPESEIDAAPPNATVRGMFFDFAVDRAKRVTGRSIASESRVAFLQYSMRDYMRLLVACAREAFPLAPPREQLRRMGAFLYDDFLETMVGRAIFSVAGKRFDRIGVLAPKAYSASYSPCVLHTSIVEANTVHIRFDPMHVFMDTFHYGAWEGAARFSGKEATIRVHRSRPGYGEFEIKYR